MKPHHALASGLAACALAASAMASPFTLPVPETQPIPYGESFSNPVIPGFSPDPSIVRVEDDFYLVCSSFEYFPGVPIYHSKDLVNWELISYCLTRESQLPLGDCAASSGIYAPTLRYHEGVFYMITTNYASDGVFYVTATDPRGEWSEPIWLGNRNVDPSLLFADGKIYLVHPDGGEKGIAYLMEIDPFTGRYAEGQQLPGKFLWAGTGGIYLEAPHLYKIGDYYYLMLAEGGTGFEHRETIARSKSPWGPYLPWEINPILTHRDLFDDPIGATGHADLVQLKDGSWWSVFLGIRPRDRRSHLGRESFLAPVEWTKDGWPVIGGDRRVSLEMKGPDLPRHPFPKKPERDEFESADLDLEWNYLRNPDLYRYSLSAKPGWLQLRGSSSNLDDRSSPTALLRRLRHFDAEVAATIDFSPQADGEEAGLTFRMNEALHAEIAILRQNGQNRLIVRQTDREKKTILFERKAPAGPIELSVLADRDTFAFRYATPGKAPKTVATVTTDDLSVEASWDRGITCFT